MSPERQLDAWTTQWSIQALARLTLTVAVVLGLLIVVGGDARWSTPSYATALRFPGAPESWGVVLTLAGLLGIVGSLSGWLRLAGGALFATSVWCLFFAWSLADAAWANPLAGTTGVPIYLFAAVVSGLLGLVHWKSAARPRCR